MDYEFSINDYWRLLRRRSLILVAVFLASLIVGSIIVISLPPFYQSYGTILVESQQIPSELVQSTVTSVAEERIKVIEQRVMTRANLLQIIDKYDIFEDEGTSMSVTQMLDTLRPRIDVTIEEIRQQGRRAREETAVVFTVTYEDKDRHRALRVTNEFVTLFLEENVKSRTTRASETTDFLTQESLRLEAALATLERAIADFKAENSNALPEHLNLHFSMLERAKDDLGRMDVNIRQTREEIQLYDLELTALRSGRATNGDQAFFTPARELAQLQSQLAELRLGYHDAHPEIQSIIDRIKALQGQVQEKDARQSLADKIAEAEIRRESLLTGRSPADPEIVALDARLTELRDELAAIPSSDPLTEGLTSFELQDARLRYRRTALEQRITDWTLEQDRLRIEVQDLEARILLTPQIESELTSLERSYSGGLEQYNEVKRKQQDAELAENLEQDQKAERFILLEPPVLAEEPSSPNRPQLIAVVIIIAAALGVSFAFIKDVMTGTIHSPSQLRHRLGEVRVISMPRIITIREKRRRRKITLIGVAALPMLILVTATMIHFLYKPLDQIFYKMVDFL